MSENDRQEWDAQELVQWREAQRWLATADQDILAAQKLLPDLVNQAAFHVQQSVEKALKALMVAKRQDIRKSHDLSMLVSLVRPPWPDLVPPQFPLTEITEWYIMSRYPGLDDLILPISEVTAALKSALEFVTIVRAQCPPKAMLGG